MTERKLLESWDLEAIDTRIAKMGRELYQLIEDYPALDRPGWGYTVSIGFLHLQILDEAMKLKHAAIAIGHSQPSNALKEVS
jgi:hypothetical protein